MIGTYKLKKRSLQAEAFHVARIVDPLFFLHKGQYVPLTLDLYDDIIKGSIRL
jgi:hypothetical protein